MHSYILMINLYDIKKEERLREIYVVLNNNLSNNIFEKICIYYEYQDEKILFSSMLNTKKKPNQIRKKMIELLRNDKIELLFTNHRLTYKDFFMDANKKFPGKIVLVANSDIYYDQTLRKLDNIDMNDKFIVLTRYNVVGQNIYLQTLRSATYPFDTYSTEMLKNENKELQNHLSIDTWIFKSPIIINFECDILLGKYKSDSILNYQLSNFSNYKVFNPCYSIISYHYDKNVDSKSIDQYNEYDKYLSEEQLEQARKGKVKWCEIMDISKKVVVLGNGPSMKNFDFTKLNDVPTIGLNAAYRYWETINWYPTYYCCFDVELIKTHHKFIRELLLRNKVKKIFVRDNFFYYYPKLRENNQIVTLESLIKENRFFKSTRPSIITTGGYAIRVGMCLGFDTILLLGIDCKYIQILDEAKKVDNSDVKLEIDSNIKKNPNYFFDDYQRVGDKFHIPDPIKNLHSIVFEILRDDIKIYNFNNKVVNCNKNSIIYDKNIFPYNSIEKELQYI